MTSDERLDKEAYWLIGMGLIVLGFVLWSLQDLYLNHTAAFWNMAGVVASILSILIVPFIVGFIAHRLYRGVRSVMSGGSDA